MTAKSNKYDDAAGAGRRPRPTTAVRTPRTDPIRTTLDLPPSVNRTVKRWCAEAAVEADVSSVPMTTVLRLLLGLLTEGEPLDDPLRDPELQGRLREAVLRGIVRQDPDRT